MVEPPHLKNIIVKMGENLPQGSGWKFSKHLSCHHLGIFYGSTIVGGCFNPFEKYANRQNGWTSSPRIGVNIKKMLETTTQTNSQSQLQIKNGGIGRFLFLSFCQTDYFQEGFCLVVSGWRILGFTKIPKPQTYFSKNGVWIGFSSLLDGWFEKGSLL